VALQIAGIVGGGVYGEEALGRLSDICRASSLLRPPRDAWVFYQERGHRLAATRSYAYRTVNQASGAGASAAQGMHGSVCKMGKLLLAAAALLAVLLIDYALVGAVQDFHARLAVSGGARLNLYCAELRWAGKSTTKA
jgi:hypothetical protein